MDSLIQPFDISEVHPMCERMKSTQGEGHRRIRKQQGTLGKLRSVLLQQPLKPETGVRYLKSPRYPLTCWDLVL